MYYRLEIFVLLISNSHTQFPCQLILLSNLVSVLYVFKYLIHCYNPFTLLFNKIIICRISSTETINDTKGLPKKADNMESVLTVKLSYFPPINSPRLRREIAAYQMDMLRTCFVFPRISLVFDLLDGGIGGAIKFELEDIDIV